MTALTENTANSYEAYRSLASISIANQSAASTAVTRWVKVPTWANQVTFLLWVDAMTGTAPLLDFTVRYPDLYGYPDDGVFASATVPGIAGWNGITQVTAATLTVYTIDIGPSVTGIADDDTGSATASSHYAINAVLPPALAYTYTTAGGGASPEDYTFRIACHFRR